ncbi:3-dehydroquinate synthase [Pontibacillus yanchengensis]|uniref:3-dehydroquinate synthase n=1 Tax=Pontibacillus yanchengensis TaxID=462910 RepID=A0ACC7VFW6_9BACI|nr:3-dehydroquinate synthase II [Pontibacillus yanchengensis]MYL53843.1 3-dehydroquinate synthase [Pontibacillus yanchengensis]
MTNQIENQQEYMGITNITEVGEGMRVCLDFIDYLKPNEGVYVGNTGHGYIKVLSENRSSEGYPPRAFRINVGAFHQYLFQEEKTLYLDEVNPGEKVWLTDEEESRSLAVGRVKIEKRPFVRVECKMDQGSISATLQYSPSVHLLEKTKGETSVLNLKVGDQVLCLQDKPGRHLGEQVDEEIIEK